MRAPRNHGSRRRRIGIASCGFLALVASVSLMGLLLTPTAVKTAASPRVQTPSPTAVVLSAPPTHLPFDEPVAQDESTPEVSLSEPGRDFVIAIAAAVLQEKRSAQGELLMDLRRSHARQHSIAHIRGCFVSLIRHSDEGIHRFHRLLVNVRQRLPKMAALYPFVAFHEQAVSSTALAKALLNAELEFVEGHQLYSGSVWPHSDEMRKRGHQDSPKKSDSDAPDVLSSDVITSAGDDAAALRLWMRRFVFPKSVAQSSPAASHHHRWPHDSGDISGVDFAALPMEDFGAIPSHIRSGQWPYPQNSWWGVSYRHMCRFFGLRIFFTSFFKENKFDYYLRLDTDSFLLATPLHVVEDSRDDRKLEEVDYFDVMQRRGGQYAFSMLHPQTISQFLTDVYETYDEFLQSENQDKYIPNAVVERHQGRVGRSTHQPLRRPLSELPFPRRDLVHFWDNFEIVDLSLFRDRKGFDPTCAERAQRLANERTVRSSRSHVWGSVLGNLSDSAAAHPWRPATDAVGVMPGSWHADDFDALVEGSEWHVVNDTALLDAVLLRVHDAAAQHSAVDVERLLSDTKWKGNEARASVLAATAARYVTLQYDSVIARAQRQLKRTYDVAVKEHNERLRRIQSWLALLEAKGGFYYHRWGDAEIRTLTVALFINATKVLYCDSLPYQHYFNFHCPSRENQVASALLTDGMQAAYRKEVEACEAEARRGYGEGSKQRGTARMNPAEGSHYNAAFEKARRETPGGWMSV